MDTNFKTKLEELGADVDNTILRFMGKEDLYLKFLNKFQNDQSFANIEKYLAEENAEEAFKAAHTLKGVAANLGLDPIAGCASEITELLRHKEDFTDVDRGTLNSTKERLQNNYHSLIDVLTSCQ